MIASFESFYKNHNVWIIPIAGALISIFIRVCSKPKNKSYSAKEFFYEFCDFGFDLTVTVFVSLIAKLNHPNADQLLILTSIVLIFFIVIIVSFFGWDTASDSKNLIGFILPDCMAVVFLIILINYN